MNIPSLCIRRPVFTIVISLMMIILGVMAFHDLPVRYLPDIDKPVISISTAYPGASPQLIEQEVTTPIENELAGISGVDNMHSTSSLGMSQVKIRFNLGVNISEQLDDIRNKLASIRKHMPSDVEPPVIRKVDGGGNPAVIFAFTDKNKSAIAISDYVNRYVFNQLEEVDGVGEVFFFGGHSYAIRIGLQPDKMAARSVTIADIKNAMAQQNLNVPSGQIKSRNRYYTVITNARFKDAQQFKKLIIKVQNGYAIHLSDVATVVVGPEDVESALRVDGQPAVGLGVIPQSTANPVTVAKKAIATINHLRSTLPNGMQAKVVYNKANFIKQSINEVYRTLIEAIIFVVLVVFLFLGNMRSALIPIVTVPICLLAVFWPMSLLGYSINTLTLLALVLAIGLVVDDAIVMLENIYRHIQKGMTPIQAAFKGSREIVFAIIAMTVTLAAVFAPLGFTGGLTGKLFLQFGITLSAAVIISGFVALTLSPMMCGRFLQNKQEGKFSAWLDRLFAKLTASYKNGLRWVFNKRIYVVLLLILFSGGGYYLYHTLPSELAPTEDQGAIIGVVSSPNNSSFSYTNAYTKQIEKLYDAIPEKQAYLMAAGFPDPSSAFSILILKPWQQRERSQKQISAELGKKMRAIPGIDAFPVSPAPLGRRHSNNHGLSIRMMTTGSYASLNTVMNNMVTQLEQYPGLSNVSNNLQLNSAQFRVDINRNLAADMHVNVGDIANTIATMLGGSNPGNFEYDGQSYKIILQLPRSQRGDVAALKQLYVANREGKMVPLANLISISNDIGPSELPHFNRMRSAELSAEITPGYNMGEAIKFIQQQFKQLPENVKYQFSGGAKDYTQTLGRTAMAFMLALLFIYLVMAAQFESFVDPLIILFAVPLSLVGALLSLKLSGGTINIYSNIGMVTLIGLISKHGILITEFANQLRKQGYELREAVIEAAALRLRPILMTTAAMVLGALPLALASGAGAASRQQIGWVIVGGMLIGTFFSLVVVPVAYSYLARKQLKATIVDETHNVATQQPLIDTK